MDFRTPCQILLGVLLAATSVAILGLAADNVVYVQAHQHHSAVKIHYTRWNETAQGQYAYWLTMEYVPSRFSMGTMYAMLATGVICGLIGVGIAVASWTMRGKTALETGFSMQKQHKRAVPVLPITLVLTTIAFLISLALTIYVWYPVMRLPTEFQNSLPLPPNRSSAASTGQGIYKSAITFTPEVWNCLLSPYVVNPAQAKRLQGLCLESGVARSLMLPVLILSAALLSCLLWAWRQARLAAASDAENVTAKEMEIEEVSVHGKE